MVSQGMFQKEMSERVNFGFLIGLLASTGVSIFRDVVYAMRGQGKIQTWKLYITDGVLGAFVGSALAFYLDALQVPVIIEKFRMYVSAGFEQKDFVTFPLLNKWGKINLGTYTGGVKLIYNESLAGVINWAVAAWLFAVNKAFMQACFDKDRTPIKFFFSKAGFATLTENMIYVLRWGLWMSPIIATFLRMMPNPTWYNQDGAIRTMVAIFNNATMTKEAFNAWSLQTFVWVLAFDLFRVLIWMDHMGLRVATLVNLSFLGMDKLDEKVAKFIGPAVAQRYIPEGVKRFTTWAPLLIPFYIPRGEQWEYAWNTAESIQNANKGKGLVPFLQSLSALQLVLLAVALVILCAGISSLVRAMHRRSQKKTLRKYEIGNREYKVTLKENGEVYSEVIAKESDVTRRSYDLVDPCGRFLYLVDTAESPTSGARAWPVAGNFPEEYFDLSHTERDEDTLKIVNTSNGIKTTITIKLPDQDSTAELWNVTVENLTDRQRQLKVVPYLEWVLNGWMHDRFHTQYQRLYPEMEYVSGMNAILSWNKSTKSMGLLASDVAPEGFLTGRVDFIGRARSIWSPRALETLDFLEAKDTPACPTFDPIGSFLINFTVDPKSTKSLNLMIGFAKKKDQALSLIKKFMRANTIKSPSSFLPKRHSLLIGHGEIPPGTPQPYYEYSDNGNKLFVRTPYTPRPFDHGMANSVHSLMVTNRGLHTSCNGNSQQNRVTPDWPDTVTREIPSEAIYLYDVDRSEWYSPTHHPLNDHSAKNEAEFSVDGTAVFRMAKGDLSTELTVFVPTQDPTGVYLLTIRNHADHARQIRIAPYFQMALAFQPERSGPLGVHYDKTLDALFFDNPRNTFRAGPAFASMSIPADRVETKRGRFFGSGRGPAHPFMVEKGEPDAAQLTDSAQVASFLGTLKIPARGEYTVAVVLGQTDNRKKAVQLVQKYKSLDMVRKTLEETRSWWLSLMGTAEVQTSQPEFDRYQNWLKYQALAERIWARRGFYQTSGAFGFRDQLQDTVNLTWVDPALARKQILLHASQQFTEGDVFHWFFTLTDGRSAFSCRSHASDNLLWIAWGVGEYVRITGDETILDEMTTYVSSEFPFAPLPKNKHGWGSLYGRSTRADTVYRHCMRSIDTVLNQRMGRNGLPLMGVGDWNDGLDEIGSEGKGESVWLGFFLYYILKEMLQVIETKDGAKRKEHYAQKMKDLAAALETTWRGDRYLRAIHDNGTEIGVKDSGVWEIDALTAAWSVMTGINFERSVTIFNTALSVLERGSVILLGWPALREDTKPYLGRSSKYPEGVRENGMYCHGVQWLIRAGRLLAEEFERRGDKAKAEEYRATAYRLWCKISPLAHVTPQEIEIYGGQPNKQPADFLTTFESGRMIWNGYTGAAGWMLRQAFEGVVGATLLHNELLLPQDIDQPRGDLRVFRVQRDVTKSPFYSGRPVTSKGKVGVLPPEVKAY
jgi:cyclic beta-1,2-glucan synthetase